MVCYLISFKLACNCLIDMTSSIEHEGKLNPSNSKPLQVIPEAATLTRSESTPNTNFNLDLT